MNLRILSSEDIKRALPMEKAVEIMNEAFVEISKGSAIIPPRTHLGISEYKGDSLIMPIYMPSNKKIGLKLITLFDENYQKQLPLIHAMIMIFDATDGRPLALMDGSYLTALRTGAGSGLATKILARKDSKVVAIFGAGTQGRTQLEAVNAVRTIEQVLIYDKNIQNSINFSSEMSKKLGLDISVPKSEEELQTADIICTATNSERPVFMDKFVQDGVHINAIGSYKPYVREIPTETVVRCKVVVDHLESCLTEAGDLLIPLKEGAIGKEHFKIELGKLISDNMLVRKTEKDLTLFKSVGNAVQDLVTAHHILLEAHKLDIGSEVQL